MDKTHILNAGHQKVFLDGISDLYEKHGETIDKAIEATEKKIRTVTFSVVIDKSNRSPSFDTKVRMVVKDPLKDHRKSVSEDPDQMPINYENPDDIDEEPPVKVATPSAPKKSAKKASKKAK